MPSLVIRELSDRWGVDDLESRKGESELGLEVNASVGMGDGIGVVVGLVDKGVR